MKKSKYTDEERQQALDWLKKTIKPRLQFAKGIVRMTEEEVDSITLSPDKNNQRRLEDLFRMVWFNWVYDEDEFSTVESPMMGNESSLIVLAPEYGDEEVDTSTYETIGYTFMELLEIIYAGQNCGFSFLLSNDKTLLAVINYFDWTHYVWFYSAAEQLGYLQDIFEKAYQEHKAYVETLEKLNKQ